MAEAGSGLTFDRIITPAAAENALRVLLAISGSTNAVVHLAAIFGRLGISLDMDLLNSLSDETPVLVDLKPTGAHYMEDLHVAGCEPAVLSALRDRMNLAVPTITVRPLGEVSDATDQCVA